MLKKFCANYLLLVLVPVLMFSMASCSKKDDTPPPVLATKEYSLRYSGAEVGKVLISEKVDGNASLRITLNTSAVVAGASPSASITAVVAGVEAGLYASLTTFGAGASVSTTDPVLNATPPNTAIPYATLISQTGYVIKVTINPTIQYTATL